MSNFNRNTLPTLELIRRQAELGVMPSFVELMQVFSEISDNAYEIAPSSEDATCCENSSCPVSNYHPGRVCSSC